MKNEGVEVPTNVGQGKGGGWWFLQTRDTGGGPTNEGQIGGGMLVPTNEGRGAGLTNEGRGGSPYMDRGVPINGGGPPIKEGGPL